ncbi:hypothetical protein M0813_20576 [Anaeramoeba flamelloides]|uniref:Sulfatase N-terminal domain-containing protein n=1 Tax=Anaeramoeba flamelloides TaxID=1746091 RepID=A0ABQ8YKQ7_9EUKA|nr:hypothetical protein M0813_20576 [Anaeramoeba flamelloides]
MNEIPQENKQKEYKQFGLKEKPQGFTKVLKANRILLALFLIFWIIGIYYSSTGFIANENEHIFFQQIKSIAKSAFCFLVCVLLFFRTKFQKKTKVAVLLLFFLQFVVLSFLKTGPTNTDLTRQFIAIIFLVILFLFGMIFTMVFLFTKFVVVPLKSKYSREMVIVAIVFLFVLIFYFSYRKSYLTEHWNDGLHGKKQLQSEEINCEYPKYVPWIDFFPDGFLNFFLGSSKCPKYKDFSKIVNRELIMDCPQSKNPRYVLYPDFLSTRSLIDGQFKIFQKEFHQLLERDKKETLPQKYTGPVSVKDSFYIRTFCGKKENYLITLPKIEKNNKDNKNSNSADKKMQNNNENENENGNENGNKNEINENENEKTHVQIFLLDCISRQHFYRKLKKTTTLLETLSEGSDYKVYDFERYGAVGRHTRTTVLPMMCRLFNNPKWEKKGYPDCTKKMPLYQFKQNDYRTMFIANFCEDTLKSYWNATQETLNLDYYLATPFCHPEYHAEQTLFKGPYSATKRCIGNKHVHEYVFDLQKQFRYAHSDEARMSLSYLIEGHEGSLEVIKQVDGDLANYLEWSIKEDQIKQQSTITIILADHGCHAGPYPRFTKAGKLENKTPSLFMIMPKEYLLKYPEIEKNLDINQHILVTAFDINHTLIDLSNYPYTKDFGVKTYKQYSLLRSLPQDRSCKSVRLLNDRCACKEQ